MSQITSSYRRLVAYGVFVLFLCENTNWVTTARLTRQTSSSREIEGKQDRLIILWPDM